MHLRYPDPGHKSCGAPDDGLGGRGGHTNQCASHKAGAASIPEAPLRAASIPSLFEHVVEAYTT